MSGGGDQTPRRRSRPSIHVGRLLATGFTAFLLIFIVIEAATDGMSFSAELIGIIVVLVLAVLAVAVAWWDASLGTYALATAGLAVVFLVAVTADSNQVAGMVVMGGPYFLSSILIWFGLWRLPQT